MNRMRAVPIVLRVIVWLSCMLAAATASAGSPPGEAIAKAYGLDSFGSIVAIRFMFNVSRKGLDVHREWMWEPKTNTVTYRGPDDKGQIIDLIYDRNNLDTTARPIIKAVDPRFINDQYWLLFPFHLVWDKDASVRDEGRSPLPMGGGKADHLVIQYPSKGGYTPGDAFELFAGPDHIIRQWIYRRGGAPKPTLVSTWAKNMALGPIIVSLEHLSADKATKIWFTNVAVKVEGSTEWTTPTTTGGRR